MSFTIITSFQGWGGNNGDITLHCLIKGKIEAYKRTLLTEAISNYKI